MNWEQEHKIIKYLHGINDTIEGIRKNLGNIEGIDGHVRSAKIEVLQIVDLFKKHNEPKEQEQKTEKITENKGAETVVK